MSMSTFYTQERNSKVNKDFALDEGMSLCYSGRVDKTKN